MGLDCAHFPHSHEIQIGTSTYTLIKTFGGKLREICMSLENREFQLWLSQLLQKNYGKNRIHVVCIIDISKVVGIGLYTVRTHGQLRWIFVDAEYRTQKIGSTILQNILIDMRGKVQEIHYSAQALDDGMEERWADFLRSSIASQGFHAVNIETC